MSCPRMVCQFEILGKKPVAKGRPIYSSRNRTFRTPPDTVAWQNDVRAAARAAMDGFPPMTGPVWVTMDFRLPIPASWSKTKKQAAVARLILPTQTPDLDNLEKSVADAMKDIVYLDDAQICAIRSEKLFGEVRAFITVNEYVHAQRSYPLPKRLR